VPRPEPILQKLSYVDVPDFFTDGESGYKAFDSKIIASVDELRQQNRTIWFVRDVRDGDLTHEIKLLDSHQIEPSDFPREHIASSSTDLLWVSDLHFSEDGRHAFSLKTEPTGNRSAWGAIQMKLDDLGIQNIAGVIASGDFAWKAAPSEFDQARTSFFDAARNWSKELKNYHFLVCPGNHDLRFSPSPDEKTQPVSVAPAEARAAYEDFYQNLYFKRPNEFLSCGRRLLLGNVVPLEIACLNSCLLDQTENLFQGQGFVGEAQMRDAARQLGWDSNRKGPRAIRIVVVHHHLLPVSYSEAPFQGWQYSLTLDAEALMRWALEHDVDLVLHGHQHQPFYTQVDRSINLKDVDTDSRKTTIVGMGSTGVDLGHLGETRSNMFALLSFGAQEVRFRFFSIDRRNPPQSLFDFRVDLSKRSRLV
jgi:3',5'-cyclic AMP phosphodiesterase CpdA